MKYKDQEIITYFPAENVAGMYLVLEGEESPILISFGEFAIVVKENQENSKQ